MFIDIFFYVSNREPNILIYKHGHAMELYLEVWLCRAMQRTGSGLASRGISTVQKSSIPCCTSSGGICTRCQQLGNGAKNQQVHRLGSAREWERILERIAAQKTKSLCFVGVG